MSTQAEVNKSEREEVLFEINSLMHDLNLSTQGDVSKAVLKETDHLISQGTISRLLKGGASEATEAFVHYALKNIKSKLCSPSDLHEDYLGSQEQTPDSESMLITHFMVATSEEEALKKVSSLGFDVVGNHEISRGYETAGEWLARGATVEYIRTMRCYGVTMHWYLDV